MKQYRKRLVHTIDMEQKQWFHRKERQALLTRKKNHLLSPQRPTMPIESAIPDNQVRARLSRRSRSISRWTVSPFTSSWASTTTRSSSLFVFKSRTREKWETSRITADAQFLKPRWRLNQKSTPWALIVENAHSQTMYGCRRRGDERHHAKQKQELARKERRRAYRRVKRFTSFRERAAVVAVGRSCRAGIVMDDVE